MKVIFSLFAFLFFHTMLIGQLELNTLFADHMVFQRNQPIRVWGKAAPKQQVAIKWNGADYATAADTDGNWRVEMPALTEGGPYSMEIQAASKKLVIKDILIGDVWVCSGQSNMEWSIANSNNAAAEIAGASDPLIRHCYVPHTVAEKPAASLEKATWNITSPETAGKFTAVGYYFARELRKNVNVPIGLLHSSWGGSRIEPWMSAESLKHKDTESAVAAVKAESKRLRDAIMSKYPNLTDKDQGMNGSDPIWAAADLDDKNWESIPVPGLWENAGFKHFDGICWYRTTFTLSEAEAKLGIELGLGKIDDSDISWVNGKEVGSMEQSYSEERVYQVPAEVLKAGVNTIAIRVEDTGGGGGIWGDPESVYLKVGGQKKSLAPAWKFRPGALKVSLEFINPNQTPTLLYNKMIHPILNFPIKGVLWYQGESNANNREDALEYSKLFADMITNWRALWNVGDFPFLYVQLANFMAPQDKPVESNWAVLRESQSNALKLKNTGQAVIIDIGDADDIHPRNKQDVGLRLSLAARKIAYGQDLVYSGPVYKSQKVDSKAIIVEFDHVGDGLKCVDKYGYLKGFIIAGKDKQFVWAKAEIVEKNQVKVWSDDVKAPMYVRYGWADNPDDANLYNSADLPTCPFRTDK